MIDHDTSRYIPMVIETNLSKNDIAIYQDVHIMMDHDLQFFQNIFYHITIYHDVKSW